METAKPVTSDTRLRRRPWFGCAIGCLTLPIIGLWIGYQMLSGGPWYISDGPEYTREPSPYGNCDIISEHRSFFLDSYMKVWVTTPGNQERSSWQLIGPEVDGVYFIDWTASDHCILTNYGWPKQGKARQVAVFDGIKIDVRPAPRTTGGDSPDEMHCLTLWNYDDTRGKRCAVTLASTWQNEEHGYIELLEEGAWTVTGNWLTSNQLRLKVLPPSAGEAIPRLWRGIEIIVE